MGASCTKLRLFSHKICFNVDTIFSSLRETPCAGRLKLFSEESELFMHAVLQFVVRTRRLRGASFRGRPPEGCTPKIFKVPTSGGKNMAGVFWDSDGVLLVGLLERGEAVSQTVMC
jgi:hypothetical protein